VPVQIRLRGVYAQVIPASPPLNGQNLHFHMGLSVVHFIVGRISPHIVIPPTRQDVNEARRRETALGIPTFDADRHLYSQIAMGYPGYPDPVPYLHPPQTRYQKRVRSEAGDEVTHHYTRRFNEKIIERYEWSYLSWELA
jgi:hypothetical protein